jgi:hypothetical protein
MVSKCANPHCETVFRRFNRKGTLYAFEITKSKSGSHVEYFWLCERCAQVYSLGLGHDEQMEVRPRNRPPAGTTDDHSRRPRVPQAQV